MDFTMLRQICRRSRLNVVMEGTTNNGQAQDLWKTLQDSPSSTHSGPLHGSNVAAFLASGKEIDDPSYNAVLHYLISLGQPWHSYDEFPPHPDRAWVLPPRGKLPKQITFESRTYSCHQSHTGNSAIMFYNPQDTSITFTGVIETICQVPLHNLIQTFLIVHLHEELPPDVANMSPYTNAPSFASKLVMQSSSTFSMVIEPRHIITHLTMYPRPAGTFNIPYKTMAICWALNRGRK